MTLPHLIYDVIVAAFLSGSGSYVLYKVLHVDRLEKTGRITAESAERLRSTRMKVAAIGGIILGPLYFIWQVFLN
jgi:hypothetical protein